MAINIEKERPIPIGKVPDWLEQHGFKRPDMRRVYDWIERGWLRTCKVGGLRYSSVEALQEMTEREESPPTTGRGGAKRVRRQKVPPAPEADAAADASLREIGWM